MRSDLQTLTRPREVGARSFACVCGPRALLSRSLIDGKPFNDIKFITLKCKQSFCLHKSVYVSVFSTGNELLVSIRIYNNNKTGLSEKTYIELNDGRLFQNLLKLGYLKALNPTTKL